MEQKNIPNLNKLYNIDSKIATIWYKHLHMKAIPKPESCVTNGNNQQFLLTINYIRR